MPFQQTVSLAATIRCCNQEAGRRAGGKQQQFGVESCPAPRHYPKMAIRPSTGESLRLKGSFEFAAHHAKEGDLQDSFVLEIIVPCAFPKALPSVTETGGKIPRTGEYHVNQTDHTLCLV